MNWYIELVTAYPILTAMVQFALLGTAGDLIASRIAKIKTAGVPVEIETPAEKINYRIILLKMLEWALLALFIKYAFIGYYGFVDNLILQGYLPQIEGIAKAFAISAAMNLQFGLFLVLMHRYLDNIIEGKKNWKNIDKGFYSLLWFWIPAHTITFILPKEFQIGLAAVWSLALGIILGFYRRKE
jgi:hypothetical protein